MTKILFLEGKLGSRRVRQLAYKDSYARNQVTLLLVNQAHTKMSNCFIILFLRLEVFCNKSVLKNAPIFFEKPLCLSLFFKSLY